MARPDSRRLFVPHRRIISNEGAHGRGRGNKMNSQPPAHAIADYANASPIDIPARKTISPTAIDYAYEIGIRCFVLNLSAFVDVSFRRVAKHVIQIGNDSRIAELGESIRRCLQRAWVNRTTRLLFFVELFEETVARELIDNRIILKRIQCYAFLTHEFQDRLDGFGFSSRHTI